MATETQLHRALADPRRRRLVDELRASPEGLDARELAGLLQLHANTVRWHLGVLADAGVVRSSPAPNGRPGRPRIVYRLSAGAGAPGRDEYRLLATILAGAIAEDGSGVRRAEDSGRAWGRYLVERPAPNVRLSKSDAVSEVVRLLDEQGFVPEAAGADVRMRRCPFHDLAEEQPEVVCAVHRGMISGALAELGSDLEVDRLDVFVQPDLCVAHLGRRGESPSAP